MKTLIDVYEWSPFSMLKNGYFFILGLFFFILWEPAMAQKNSPESVTINDFKKTFKKIVKDFDLNEETILVKYNSGKDTFDYHISGEMAMFGVQDVSLEVIAGPNEKIIEITALFPSGASNQIELDGEKIKLWIPAMLQNKIDLEKVHILLYPQEKETYVITSLFRQPENNVVGYMNCQLDQTEIIFTIDKDREDKGKNADKKGQLSGVVDIGGLDFDLQGEAKSEKKQTTWEITASRNEIEMKLLIDALQKYNNVQFQTFPDALMDVALYEPVVKFDNEKVLSLKGRTDIGRIEAVCIFNSGSKNDFLLGFRPEEDYSLAKLNNNLRYIDGVDLGNMAIVYAYSQNAQKEISLELLDEMDFSSEKVRPGFVLLGKYEMPTKRVPLLEKINSVTVRTDMPAEKNAAIKLTGKLDHTSLDLGLFQVKDLNISLEPSTKVAAIGMSVEGTIPELRGGGDALTLHAQMALDPTNKDLNLILYMAGGQKWDTPFGFPGITISNFGLDVGATGPAKKIGVRGDLMLGSLQANIAGFLDSKDLMKSMISVRYNELSLEKLMQGFFDQDAQQYLKSLPLGAIPMSLKDVEVTMIPSAMTIAEKNYDPGLRIKGDGRIMQLGARLDLLAAYDSGIRGYATLDRISLPNAGLKIFDLGGEAMLDFTKAGLTDPNHSFMKMNGVVDILSLSRNANIDVSKTGFGFASEGKIFNMFSAGISAKGNDLFTPQNMQLQVAMRSDFLNSLNSAATNILAQETKAKQEAFRAARDLVEFTKNAYEQGIKRIDDAQKAKDNALGAVDRAWELVPPEICTDKIINVTVETVEKVPIIGGLFGKVIGWTTKTVTEVIPEARKVCAPVPLKQIPPYIRATVPGTSVGVDIPMPNYENLKKGIDIANEGLNKAIDELQKANDNINPLRLAFEGAKTPLNLLETATDYFSLAAKWLLDNGAGGAIDIKSAEFAGQLNSIQSGSVSMKCNVVFVGQTFTLMLPFNFNASGAVDGMAKAMVNTLLQGKAQSGLVSIGDV
ncbi:MAG: hypothetical protein IPH16_19460 [Haliscomenobacter sp.]|nr:hypothetical protein [Haliscomenobacter sp.]